jgi:hypothetical protein
MKERAGLVKACPHTYALVEVILAGRFKKQSKKK